MKFIKTLFSNEFVKGGTYITIASQVVNVLAYLFNLLVARALGPEGLGEIAALFSYMIILTIPTMVINLMVIQKISSVGENRYKMAIKIEHYAYRLMKKYLPFFGILLIIPFTQGLTNLSLAGTYALPFLLFFGALSSFFFAITQGLRMFKEMAYISLLASTVRILAPLAAFFGYGNITSIVVGVVVSQVAFIIGLKFYIHNHTKTITIPAQSNTSLKNIIHSKRFYITAISTVAITLLGNIDIVLVKKLFDADTAGIYASWSLLAKIILYLTGPMIPVTYIFFSGTKDITKNRNVAYITVLFFALFGLASYIGYTTFGTFLIFMLFGSQFDAVLSFIGSASLFGIGYTFVSYANSFFISQESKKALILAFTLPLYGISLWFLGTSIEAIIRINVLAIGLISCAYLIAYLHTFFYNSRNEFKAT